MQLTDNQIAQFQEIHKKYFGKEISKELAEEKGKRLIDNIKLIFYSKRPIITKEK
jgi:hypothetical protein